MATEKATANRFMVEPPGLYAFGQCVCNYTHYQMEETKVSCNFRFISVVEFFVTFFFFFFVVLTHFRLYRKMSYPQKASIQSQVH